MHAAIVVHLVAYCPVSLWYRFCSVSVASVTTSFLLALSFCSCRLVGRRFCTVLQCCGTCCSLWFSAPVCTLVRFAGGCRWWMGSRVLSFHGRAFWRDFYCVYWLVVLFRGVPSVAMQESAVLSYVFLCLLYTYRFYGFSGMWLRAHIT